MDWTLLPLPTTHKHLNGINSMEKKKQLHSHSINTKLLFRQEKYKRVRIRIS